MLITHGLGAQSARPLRLLRASVSLAGAARPGVATRCSAARAIGLQLAACKSTGTRREQRHGHELGHGHGHGHVSPLDSHAEARAWLCALTAHTIPRAICEVSYSRSSGPGGQNVNKLNTKATLRVPLSSLLPLVPPLLHQALLQSRYYTPSSHSLLIQSDESRRRSDNMEACYTKLLGMLRAAGAEAVPGETSDEQKRRVLALQRRDNEARLRRKKMASAKKQGRAKGGLD